MSLTTRVLAALTSAVVLLLTATVPASAAQRDGSAEDELLDLINEARADGGLSPVARVSRMDLTAYSWSYEWYESWQTYGCSETECDNVLANYAPPFPSYGSGSQHKGAEAWGPWGSHAQAAFSSLDRKVVMIADATEAGIAVVRHGDLSFVGVGIRAGRVKPEPEPFPPSDGDAFTDTSDSVHADAINAIADAGITGGTTTALSGPVCR